MEVEYLIERLGPYLGGIDVEKVRSLLGATQSGVERLLGIETQTDDNLEELECARIRSFAERYLQEGERLRALYRELKAAGLAPSDMAGLKKKIREAKRRASLYREMLKRCQSRSVASHIRPQS
ncbi:MAG: hypothetical protein ACP5H5_04885 [Pyrobaculum sp.]